MKTYVSLSRACLLGTSKQHQHSSKFVIMQFSLDHSEQCIMFKLSAIGYL